jgi:hypothetical protein
MTASMILRNLHLLAGWQPILGPSIAPNNPSAFNMKVGGNPYYPNAAFISITGKPGLYTGGMYALSIPLPNMMGTNMPASGARFKTKFILDAGAPANMTAMEFGVKVTNTAGLTLPSNYQLDNTKSPSLTVFDLIPLVGQGNWVQVPGAGVPRLQPYQEYSVQEEFNWGSGRENVTQFSINGQTFTPPANMQGIAGLMLGWTPRPLMTVCVQPNVNQNGGSYSLTLTQCDVELTA